MPIDTEQFIHRHLRGSYRVFHRENDVLGYFDKLAHEREVLGIYRNGSRSVGNRTGHKHACDVRHSARNAVCGSNGYQVEVQMPAKLPQDIPARAFGHRLGNEVTDLIRMQRISPKHLHICGLVVEVRLMRQNDGHEPI